MTAELGGVVLTYLLLFVLYVVTHRAKVRHREGMARLAAYDARLRRDLGGRHSSMERSHAA